MSRQESVRNKLATKIFNLKTIGKTIVLKRKSSPLYNDRGELESNTETSTNIICVPYNIMDKQQSYERNGILKSGEMEVAVPWDTEVSVDDIMTIESEDWLVKEIFKNYLPENVVTIVRLVRQAN